jgi:hypothetical protein
MSKRTIEQMCERADATHPDDHLIVCPTCGQIFDCRETALVEHHGTQAHAALDPSAR